MSSLTPEKYKVVQFEHHLLCLLANGAAQTTRRLLCRLEVRNRWHHIANRLNYDLVHITLVRLLHLGLVKSDDIFMDYRWSITLAGEHLLKAFHADGG